jgi:hypothetical protein
MLPPFSRAATNELGVPVSTMDIHAGRAGRVPKNGADLIKRGGK